MRWEGKDSAVTGVFATGSDSLVVGELVGDFLLGSADSFCHCHSVASSGGQGLGPSPRDSHRDYNQTKSQSRFSLSSQKSQWSPDELASLIPLFLDVKLTSRFVKLCCPTCQPAGWRILGISQREMWGVLLFAGP